MKLFSRLKELAQKVTQPFRKDKPTTELIRSGMQLPNTRYWRRAVVRSQRLRGPGYTRSYRKGRTQRERP